MTPISEKKPIEHRVDIQLTHYTSTGARYRVTYLGATLVESARDPEFEACRALLARGITGTLVTYSPGGSVPRMRVDIEKGAKLIDRRERQRRAEVCPLQAAPRLGPRGRRRMAFPA